MKFDAVCSECGRKCMAPRGNWNAKRVVLCTLQKCRRARKTALQKQRRKQGELPLVKPAKTRKKDSQRKLKFFGGIV